MNPDPDQQKSGASPVDAGSQALADALQSSFAIVKVVMAVLVAVFLFSGCFTVGPQEKAVILRMGKPLQEGEKSLLGSGWHWGFPYPIDEVVRIPSTGIQEVKSSVGWFAQTAVQEARDEEPFAGASLNPAIDGYAITADGNIVHVKATLSYRIEDPVRCAFLFAGPENSPPLTGVARAAQNALNNALIYTTAHFKVDDILTRDKAGFQDAVRQRVTKLVADQNLGIAVENCPVEGRAPRQLKQAFELVVTAGQNRAKAMEEARSYTNQILNQASADAANILNTAGVDSSRLVAEARADESQFKALLARFNENPDLFAQQRLIESMGNALTNVQEKYFFSTSPEGKGTELRVLLNREAPKPKASPPAR